ncbi:MAG: 2-succinyl-5-enolpyruvyl-6-hydroxy-3-cyclohexene-1-carboxylic-acid synthase [Microcystaceae cyanobacterium]
MVNPSNLNSLWGFLIIEELIRNGYHYFILSPGSRCTPLTVAVARHPKAEKIIYYDERGAAFHGLGYAKATGNPAILICTSGTAAANYYPAVIESSTNHIPLIILSADRPPELQQRGANQTIKQNILYGQYTKYFLNLPCPNDKISPEMVLSIIDQACSFSKCVVHLNCAFREPLAPTSEEINLNTFPSLNKWKQTNLPYYKSSHPQLIIQPSEKEQLLSILKASEEGILCIGRLNNFSEQELVIKFAKQLNWPVFADVQSGLRLNSSIPQLIPYFDYLVLQENFNKLYPIETVLQIGDRIISKSFQQWLSKSEITHHIVVTDYEEQYDPNYTVTWQIKSNISLFCQQIIDSLSLSQQEDLLKKLQQQSQTVELTIDNILNQQTSLNEPLVSRLISHYLPAEHGLYLANSMAIREMDRYGVSDGKNRKVAANRGTSGIEGTIATASGFSKGIKAPVTVLIGDLAFLHDLNSLAQLNALDYPLIIVLVNNDGGGIFSFLPISEVSDVFEPYFGTPHGLQFKAASQLFKIDYYQPQTPTEFAQMYQTALNSSQSTLIEVISDRTYNYQLHQDLQNEILSQLSKM